MKQAEIPQNYDHFLDAKGLNCPLPVLKAKLIFEAYCARTGHTISYSNIKDEVISLYIIRAENLNNE